MSHFIRVKGWAKFQHYKDRNPPWIKLHQELLTSLTWAMADNASRVLAVSLMLLAAKSENRIPANPDYVRRVAYLHEVPDFSQLIHLEFIEIVDDSGNTVKDASAVLAVASKLQATARPETETETETEEKPSARQKTARGTSNLSQLAKAQCDTRHSRSQQLIEGWYRDWAGVDCPWDGAEGRQLSALLKAWPRGSDADFIKCLEHLAQSDCIAPGTRPCKWLHDLLKFIKGPLNEYWKPKQVQNGKPSSNIAREQRVAERTNRVIAAISGGSPAALPNGNGRRGIPGLAANPEGLQPQRSSHSSERIDLEPAGGLERTAEIAGPAANDSSSAGIKSRGTTAGGGPQDAR